MAPVTVGGATAVVEGIGSADGEATSPSLVLIETSLFPLEIASIILFLKQRGETISPRRTIKGEDLEKIVHL